MERGKALGPIALLKMGDRFPPALTRVAKSLGSMSCEAEASLASIITRTRRNEPRTAHPLHRA